MTREEAIKILHPISDEYCQIANIRMTQAEDDICEALDMAIEALRAQDHILDHTQMVCEDAISRKYISDKVRGWMKHDGYSWGELNVMNCVLQEVEDAPLVQPARKTAEWKHVDPITEAMSPKGWMPWYCSECGSGVGKHKTFFCPSCGADMRGEQNG